MPTMLLATRLPKYDAIPQWGTVMHACSPSVRFAGRNPEQPL